MKKLILIGLVLLSGCTANSRARNWGGNENVYLPHRQKLVNVTWKQDELWYLYRPMRQDEVAETSVFQEKSSFGMVEGTVKFIEVK